MRSVVVVGAGVVGLSVALWLLRRGHRVTVLDPAPPLPGVDYRGACSFGNAATIAVNACLPMAGPGILAQVPRMLADRSGPLTIFWRDLPGLLPWLWLFLRAGSPARFEHGVRVLGGLMRLAEDGHAPLMAECGAARLRRAGATLHLFHTPASLAAALPGIHKRAGQGVRFELLDAPAVRATEPALAPLYHGGVRYPDAYGLDDPLAYAAALAGAILSRGGRFVRSRARAITPRPHGVEVIAEGEALTADHVILAAGAWSARLAATLGDRVPLGTERGYHVMFPDGAGLLSAPVMYPEHGFYMSPLGPGLRCAGTVELGGLDRPPRPRRCTAMVGKARRLLPGLGAQGEDWLGFRPSTPDGLPVIGPSPADPRVLHAFGHGHVGLTLAGLTGRIVADLVDGRPPPVDIAPLRPDRFAGPFGRPRGAGAPLTA